MYLEHFGLKKPPFKITPVTDFFFPGANRAEILDALLYAISNSEGIIKVTGEVGSGKTMLCRMLLERLPGQVEAVYLANPSLTREEMLYAIADGLSLDLEGQRVNIILQTLQNHLELKIAQGKRVVILVDEAHAMPLDTMEELRLLYNLQIGNHKLLHIVLFGQPELNDKLSQPNMRQLKDRIVHHFAMLPLSQNIIETYLLFRMHTAGYRGPTPFASAAAALIGKASQGLMRRVNILADKSLLAAFVEDTHNIEVHHVQAAIRDSELSPPVQALRQRKNIAIAAALVLSATIIIAATGWLFGRMHASNQSETEVKLIKTSASTATHIPSATYAAAPAVNASASVQVTLLDQRLAAAQAMLVKSPAGSASIQLYYTDEVQPLRIEGFLKRADNLGKLHEIYVLPIKINDRKGLRVLYGVYASSEQARSGMRQLPQRYKDAFAPTIYLLEPMPAS
jgi:MSHA biogenesis protein MshM